MIYKEYYIETKKGTIYCREIGKGTPIVFLHGGPGMFHDNFTLYFNQLAEDYRLIYFDQIGSGRSSLNNVNDDLCFGDLVDSLKRVKDYLNLEPFHCIGHSFGALIAIDYAFNYPKDLLSNIMISPAPGNDQFDKEFMNNFMNRITKEDNDKMKELYSLNPIENQDIKTILKIIEIRESRRVFNKDIFRTQPNYITFDNFHKLQLVSSKLNSFFDSFDCYKILPDIKTPTIIFHGDFDPIPFESSKKFNDLLPNSKLFLLKKCGHLSFAEQTEEVLGTIRNFLKNFE